MPAQDRAGLGSSRPADRTSLAWQRCVPSLFVIAALVVRYGLREHQLVVAVSFAVLLVAVAGAAWQQSHEAARGTPRTGPVRAMTAATLVAAVGAAVLIVAG